MTSRVIISAGERVTCTNGHYIGTAARDAHLGDRFDPDSLVDWQGPPVAMRDIVGMCTCGAWWSFGSLCATVHIEGRGWTLEPDSHVLADMAERAARYPGLRHGPDAGGVSA